MAWRRCASGGTWQKCNPTQSALTFHCMSCSQRSNGGYGRVLGRSVLQLGTARGAALGALASNRRRPPGSPWGARGVGRPAGRRQLAGGWPAGMMGLWEGAGAPCIAAGDGPEGCWGRRRLDGAGTLLRV